MSKFKKRISVFIALISLVVLAAACGTSTSSPPSANTANQQVEQSQLQIYNTNQAIPVFPDSQLRQTLIDVETAQAEGIPTTTFFVPNNGGSTIKPWFSCPSIGFPVASTDELSNPLQAQWKTTYDQGSSTAGVAVGQIDPNGIYSGDSTGTYVLCTNLEGQKYVVYWEGYTFTLTGDAGLNPDGTIGDVTNPTGKFNTLTPAQQQAVNDTAIAAYKSQTAVPVTNPAPSSNGG